MSSNIEKLEIIKDQKNMLKALLVEELGDDAKQTPFTNFSTLFSAIINEKRTLSDTIVDRLNELDQLYGAGFFKTVETTLKSYAYLQQDGTTYESNETGLNNSKVTDFVEVFPLETIYVTCEASYNAYGVCFYDSDKKFLAKFPDLPAGSTNSTKLFSNQKLTVPLNAKYVRASIVYQSTVNPQISRIDNTLIQDFIRAQLDNVNLSIDNVNSDISFSNRLAVTAAEDLNTFKYGNEITIVTNDYPSKDGWQASYGFNASTDKSKTSEPIELLDAHGLFFTGHAEYDARAITYLDKNKKKIDTSSKNESFNDYEINAFQILSRYPQTKYLIFSSLYKPYALYRLSKVSNNQFEKNLENNLMCSRGKWIQNTDQIKLCADYYLDRSKGNIVSAGSRQSTEFINIKDYPKLRVSTNAQWNTAGMTLYNSAKTFLSSSLWNTSNSNVEYLANNLEIDFTKITSQPELSTAVYARFSGSTGRGYPAIEILTPYTIDEICDMALATDSQTVLDLSSYIAQSDFLYQKKYVALGDSFTSKNPPNYFTPYPELIAKRHNMQFKNHAVSGQRISKPAENIETTDAQKYFCDKIDTISADLANADYITMCFGLNESGNQELSGLSSDNSDSTFFGAWNVALNKILNWNPYVKIGIIIADAWTPIWQANLLKNIGQAWGIPVLDLKYGTNMPTMMGAGRPNMFGAVQTLRNNAFIISTDDGHPNAKAHEFRSTIIEQFIKTL